MKFKNEAEFERHLRNLIQVNICASDANLLILDNKNIADIIICKNGNNAGIFFIEVKHLKPTDGRLGFGSAKGAGFQPEILGKRPKYLESNLIWDLYSDKHENNNIVVLSGFVLTIFKAGQLAKNIMELNNQYLPVSQVLQMKVLLSM